jgi:hypothetical protein
MFHYKTNHPSTKEISNAGNMDPKGIKHEENK